MQTGSTLVRVAPGPAGGWEVREPGTTRVLGRAASKDEAVLRAHALMLNGGSVQVLDGGGFLVETHAVPGPTERPWWYVVPRPLFWWVAVLFLVQGGFGVAGRDPGGVRFWLGLVQLLLSALYLVVLVLSRRRVRRLLASEQRPG